MINNLIRPYNNNINNNNNNNILNQNSNMPIINNMQDSSFRSNNYSNNYMNNNQNPIYSLDSLNLNNNYSNLMKFIIKKGKNN